MTNKQVELMTMLNEVEEEMGFMIQQNEEFTSEFYRLEERQHSIIEMLEDEGVEL